jgi:signal transduction histidine kinase
VRDYLNMAAHELRTPLSVVAGYLGMLQDGTVAPGSAEFGQALRTMATKTDEAGSLVEHILLAARVEAHRLTLAKAALDLREVVAWAVARAEPLADPGGERPRMELPAEPVPVLGDRDLLGQALDNLITNAMTHGAGAGVSVGVGTGSSPAVRVSDRGPGIPCHLRERVFEPFFRVQEHVSGRGGTGLGLAISRGLAEAHGGTLALEPDEEAGSTFVLRLPGS